MNFGQVVKQEILNKPIKERADKKAFLAGIIRGNGSLFSRDGEMGLDFYVFGEDTANLVMNFFRILYSYEFREIAFENRINKSDKVTLTLFGNQTLEILQDLGVITDTDGELAVNLKIFSIANDESSVKAFLKGLFVSVGSCTFPSKNSNTGYHLELVFSHSAPASETMLKLAEYQVNSKITRRKESFVLYVKSAEEIRNFIAFIGAPVSVLKMTDFMINREMSNMSNRQANCDMGNVNRQIEAVEKQINAIKKIQRELGFSKLKEDLKITAEYRVKYKDESMVELAEIMGVSKSCLNHRLRKLVAIADEL